MKDSVFLALLGLARGDPDDRHSRVLQELLTRLAERPVAPSCRPPTLIPAQDQGDVVQIVQEKLMRPMEPARRLRSLVARTPSLKDVARAFEGGPPEGTVLDRGSLETADSILVAYLRRCLGNAWADILRTRARAAKHLPPRGGQDYGPGGGQDGDGEVHETLRTLERVVDSIARTGIGFHADAVKETWEQIVGLSAGAKEMDDFSLALVQGDPELAALPTEQARVKARNRLLQRHKRLRDAVRKEVARRIKRRVLSEVDGAAAEALLRSLLRRQKRNPGASTGGKDSKTMRRDELVLKLGLSDSDSLEEVQTFEVTEDGDTGKGEGLAATLIALAAIRASEPLFVQVEARVQSPSGVVAPAVPAADRTLPFRILAHQRVSGYLTIEGAPPGSRVLLGHAEPAGDAIDLDFRRGPCAVQISSNQGEYVIVAEASSGQVFRVVRHQAEAHTTAALFPGF